MWSMAARAKGGDCLSTSGGLAGIAGIEVVENRLRFRVRDRRAETIPHLLEGLLPGGAVHGRRIAGDVVEAVADDAAADRQVAPGRVLELHELGACGGTRRGVQPGEHQRGEDRSAQRCAGSHATSTLRL